MKSPVSSVTRPDRYRDQVGFDKNYGFMKEFRIFTLLLIVTILGYSSCKTTKEETEDQYGKIRIHFEHRVDNQSLVTDQMIYENAAGNKYLVNEIQYFISDVTLYKNGNTHLLDAWDDIHYVDTDIESTRTFAIRDEIPLGHYDKISFTFGINEVKNQSLMFVNPPESLMFWPELLGGGYHYMKLNGKWLDTLDQISPFNFHLGIGQIYYSFPDSISSYVQNYFEVELVDSGFELQIGETLDVTMVMNVENWFKSPHIYDHNEWGGDIMQKQDAMRLGCENGWNVFTIEK